MRARRLKSPVARRTVGLVDVTVAGPQEKVDGANAATTPQAPLPDLESFRSALDAGQVGVWSWDLRSNRMSWSTKVETFQGLAEDSVDGTLSIVAQDFPSQDAAGVLAAIHKTLQTRTPCRLEYR